MIDRATRLRWRRRFRRGRRQVEDFGTRAEESLDRHVIRRLGRFQGVRRFTIGWLTLLTILIGLLVVQTRALEPYYLYSTPAPGGIFVEGIEGAFTNANPIYAIGGVDGAVSRLVFASLLKYDQNNRLIGDLAESWSLDESGRVYTVVLRDNLVWHDGLPLTAADVAFTYRLIQNPDTRSPLFGSWQAVNVQATDARTVTFTLPNVLSSFPYSLTNGIVPKHLLENVPPAELRSAPFNTVSPVGAGPFRWDALEVSGHGPDDREERIGLVPNANYHHGAPKLHRFVVRAFRNEARLLDAFRERQLNAMVGLDDIPRNISDFADTAIFSVPTTGQTMAFFNMDVPILSDARVRQALVMSIDTKAVRESTGSILTAADSPFLRQHFSYRWDVRQFGLNPEEAQRLLDEAGWKRAEPAGTRQKDGQPLRLRLHSPAEGDIAAAAKELERQWRALGVDIYLHKPSSNDFQLTLTSRNYDILLFGISIGVDPDVFAYWHSSQADPRAPSRLNFSQYRSAVADASLKGGRTRTDPALRAVKYLPFLRAWRDDAPALAIYQPRFVYIVNGQLHNFEPTVVNSTADRFSNVHNWMIRQTKVSRL